MIYITYLFDSKKLNYHKHGNNSPNIKTFPSQFPLHFTKFQLPAYSDPVLDPWVVEWTKSKHLVITRTIPVTVSNSNKIANCCSASEKVLIASH